VRSRRPLIPLIAVAAISITLPAPSLAGQPAPRDGVSAAAPAGLLWDGDPARGTGVFDALERDPGSITVADEGQYGRSFRYETWDSADGSKERCESRGMRNPDGSLFRLDRSRLNQTYYVGWRSKLNPMPITRGRWIAFWQLHWSGAGPGGGPMTLRTLGDGNLYVQYVSPDGKVDRNIWQSPLRINQWSSFVIAYRLTTDSTGYIEFWYDGVQQKFTNGSTRWTGPIFKGTHVNNKWGVYRSGPNKGRAVNWVNHPRLGTTYDSVAP
jgi:Polysaccharide lyase